MVGGDRLGISGCKIKSKESENPAKSLTFCEVRKAFSCLAMSSSLGQDLGLRLLGPSFLGFG